MNERIGRDAPPPAMLNDNSGGPWGGRGSGGGSGGKGSGGAGGSGAGGKGGGSGGKGGGDDDDGVGPRNPWSQPPRKRPGGRAGFGPSALDEFIRRGRQRFGGFGDGFQAPQGKPIWLWAIAAFVLLWIVGTSFHTVGPQQRGVITRFGRYAGTLQPGLGMTLPAPIDQVRKIDVDNIHTIDVPNGGGDTQNLVLTGDRNMIDLAYSVRWNIRQPELYLFELAEPDDTIREVAESAMREKLATVSLTDAIGPGRGEIESQVAERMQQLLDDYHSGVLIQGVAIKQADPPAEVNDAFKKVSAAQQTTQGYLNSAHAYETQLLAQAQGEAQSFDKVYAQYKLAPEVTRRRMYYETMEKVLAKTDKTVVEAPGVVPYLPLPQAKPAAPAKAAQ